MANPRPIITKEFIEKQFKPISDLPSEKLAKKAVAVKLPESVDAKIRALPQKQRIEWIRRVLTEAALTEL